MISQSDIAMVVRIGWGSVRLHADVTGYLYGDPVETEPLNVLDTIRST